VAGLLLLLGLLAALGRRYLFPPERWISVSADGVLLILFTLIILSGLLMEGARLVGSEAAALARWPVGAAVGAAALRIVNSDTGFWARWYPALYLTHAGAGFALIAYLPFSKLFHLFAAQITTFAAGPHPRPAFGVPSRREAGARRERGDGAT
jgi:nitrate reductase gamma subunit